MDNKCFLKSITNTFRGKHLTVFLTLFVFTFSIIILPPPSTAATTFKIIQDYLDLSKPLIQTYYAGEKVDWDVRYGNKYVSGAKPTFTWSSSNSNVAIVEDFGHLTFKAKGVATITVKHNTEGVKASATVTVKQPATSISISPVVSSIIVGNSKTFTATILPSTTNDKSKGVTWSTSNPAVATINSLGKVVGIAPGSTTIKASFVNANTYGSGVAKTITKSFTLRINEPPTEDVPDVPVEVLVTKITLSNTSTILYPSQTVTVKTPTIAPIDATNTTVKWSSSNTKIATINSAGIVVAKAEGTVTIKVTANDANKATATMKVAVKRMDLDALTIDFEKDTMYIKPVPFKDEWVSHYTSQCYKNNKWESEKKLNRSSSLIVQNCNAGKSAKFRINAYSTGNLKLAISPILTLTVE